MTVTVYSAKFSSAKGAYAGSISWDKYTPKKLDANLGRYVDTNTVDYPEWSLSASYSRKGLNKLVNALKAHAIAIGLNLIEERLTRFAAGIEKVDEAKPLPDPIGKAIVILKGNLAGKEGICLGLGSEPETFAVSPNDSNQVINLRFDEEFGIVLNSGQVAGPN